MLHNPILPGFHPDPSIVAVEGVYYLATSTFEWYPGVRIYRSTDLVSWELAATPLDRPELLDLRGVPDSCGVWAPCLSHDGELFHLVYSNVKSFDGVWKDTPNYLTTAADIKGPWSDPVFLGAEGFDGSMFHDSDGKKWYLSMRVDHRKGRFFGGIIMRQYDPNTRKLTGPTYPLFEGTELGSTEGPHLYKRAGYYYLLTAEGGTEYGHAVSIARSRNIRGPYTLHPENPILSARDVPDHPLQKCGHGDLFQTKEGRWYIVFLTGRPLSQRGRCPLGRETAIEEIVWQDDWPALPYGTSLPRVRIPSPTAGAEPNDEALERIDFQHPQIPDTYQALRRPIEDAWCKPDARPGFLRLIGQESLSSTHQQSLLARRVQHTHFSYSLRMEFAPENFQQMAGLVCYYNTGHYHYLHVYGEAGGDSRWLNIISCDNFETTEALSDPIALPAAHAIRLHVQWKGASLQFCYAVAEADWRPIGPELDASILSDDYVCHGSSRYRPAFTGAFVGICCQDLTGGEQYADFGDLAYEARAKVD